MSSLVGNVDQRPISLSERLTSPVTLGLPSPPSFEILNRTLNRIIERYDRPSTAPLKHALEYLEKLLTKINDQDWSKTPLSFISQCATFAFAEEYRDEKRFQPIRQFLLDEIVVSTRQAFLNPMVRVYLDTFVAAAEHTRDIAAALDKARLRIGPIWQRLLESVPDLFRPATIVQSLATLMTSMETPFHELRLIGIRQPHSPGLMDAVHFEFLELSKTGLTTKSAIERMLAWLKPDGQSLRRTGAGQAISALLWPWRDKQPSSEITSMLIDRLTEFYGHPRASRAAAWNEVDPDLERVFMRWLMKADFRFLFRILREVEPSHMFPDREEFWRTLLETGAVDELWVAFKPDGYRAALNKLPGETRLSARRFAQQVGERDKSLLLMRIGDKIVVEGTHNFRLHFFNASSPRAPKLYQPEYDVSDIRSLPSIDSFPHLGDWQTKTRLRLFK